ncbi:hypothetical protein OQA88_230 [Cercophora sp. LCS_1]
MAERASKKRKGADGAATGPSQLTVTKIVKPEGAFPVVAVAPGLNITKSLEFLPYDKVEGSNKRRKNAPPAEMALLSTNHPAIDFVGREDGQPYLRHYIGVFDPRSGKMELVEAKKMTIRGTVRSQRAPVEAMMERKPTNFERRTELGEAFGTKKAKKAIKSVTENAITSGSAIGKMGQADLALLDAIKDTTHNMATQEELQAVIDQARPVPRGNYDAEDIHDVYVPAELVGAETLNAIPVQDWVESVKANEAINVPSRYVAHRISRVAHNENATQRLKVMRYLLWVLIFWATARPGKERGTRMIGKRDVLRSVMTSAPEVVIENIRRKFSDNGVMRKTHVDLLMTHCCVFACIIDNFEVNTLDLREDLKLEQKQLNQYFLEIGARIAQTKKAGKVDNMAKLALPLQFPKVRQIRQKRR